MTRSPGGRCFSHTFTYSFAYVPAFIWISSSLGWTTLVIVAAIALPHVIQDDGRLLIVYVRRVKGMDPVANHTVAALVDQAFHMVALFGAALLVSALELNASAKVDRMDTIEMTAPELKRLRDELNELESGGRSQIAARIKTAREWGDLKENGEYHAAKEAQAHLETRILRLREQVRAAVVVEDATGDDVRHGSTIEVTDLGKGGSQSFKIVSPNEANPKEGLISSSSPVGAGADRRRVGDEVQIPIPAGVGGCGSTRSPDRAGAEGQRRIDPAGPAAEARRRGRERRRGQGAAGPRRRAGQRRRRDPARTPAARRGCGRGRGLGVQGQCRFLSVPGAPAHNRRRYPPRGG